jgi:hypothetical protein
MLILTATTDNIQIVLSGAVTTNQLQCKTSWRDITTTLYTPGRTVINTNNTTDVNIVGSPAASTQRVVDFISVYNNDTAPAEVTIKFDAAGTEYILWKGVVGSGGSITYTDATGFVLNPATNALGFSIKVQALTSSPTDAQTVYFGMLPKAPITTANVSKVYVRRACTLKVAEIYCYSGTAGTAESWSLYVRKNNATDYLIATLAVSASERVFSNTALSIPFAVGDYFEIKGIQPTWATNPLTTIYGGYCYFE